MPIVNTKVKCPSCDRLIPKRVLLLNEGHCPYCGRLIAQPIVSFMPKKVEATQQ